MLDIQHLTKVFEPGTVNEKLALENIDLHVNRGDVICMIGSNGSGKSTLFNAISGTFPITAGRILLDGKDITRMPEYRRSFDIGRIFQDPTKGTSGSMSIQDNMMLSMSKGMKGLKYSMNRKNQELFRELIRPIGLEDRLQDNVGLLSGGQRQALTLIMVCMSHPKLLLLDEHTAALDPKNARIVMELTEKYIEKEKLTCMMVTHNMQFALEFGNRLVMMDGGHIILDVSGDEKRRLSVKDLVDEFKKKRGSGYTPDNGLLT